jgi:hypothetical protein
MPPESPFRHFPRRDAEEIPVLFMDNRADLPVHTLHMQDMGVPILDVENMLQEEIAVNAQSNVVINQQNEELLTAHDAVDVLEGTVIDLEAELAQKDALIAAKDAQIAALQAQLNPPEDDEDEDDDDEDDDDGDDDDGGDEAAAVAEKGEVEDPEEIFLEILSDEDSGEEYTPPSYDNRGGKRNRMSSSTYFKLFKKMD